MLQAKPQTDPIVEILRLAYRRGLALRQAQGISRNQEQYKTADSGNPGRETLSAAVQDNHQGSSSDEQFYLRTAG